MLLCYNFETLLLYIEQIIQYIVSIYDSWLNVSNHKIKEWFFHWNDSEFVPVQMSVKYIVHLLLSWYSWCLAGLQCSFDMFLHDTRKNILLSRPQHYLCIRHFNNIKLNQNKLLLLRRMLAFPYQIFFPIIVLSWHVQKIYPSTET